MLPIGIIACIFCSVSLISSGFLLYWVWNVSANKNQSSVFSFLLLYNFLCQAYSLAALILRDPERPVFYVICIFLISAGFYFADAHVIIEMVKIYSVLDPELLNANRLRKFRILHFLFLFGFASLCIVGLMQTYNGNIDRSLGLGFILAFVWNFVQEIYLIRLLYQTRKALLAYKSSDRHVQGNPQKAILLVLISAAILSLMILMLAVSSLPEYEITKRADLSYVGVAFNGFIVQLHIYIFFLMKRWAVPLKRQEVGHKATPQESSNVKGTEILARPVELDTVKFSDRVPGPVTPEILKSQISQPETS